MDFTPLFSLIALVKEEKQHLLAATLDSLCFQTERRFEVILVDPIGLKKWEEEVKAYDFPIQICHADQSSTSEMMNQAIQVARGKYLQFLSLGDRYLSPQGLSYLSELLVQNGEPQLIYSGFLVQGSETVVFPLERQTLQKGVFSRDCCFLRKAVLDLGGFDKALSHRFAFELLCRLYLKQEIKPIYSRRVLTDGESHRKTPRAMMGYAWDTYQILYKHFGLWHALRWIFIQDHLQMFRWVGRQLKAAFWGQPNPL